MRNQFSNLSLIAFTLCFSFSLTNIWGQTKAVAVVMDDSGSMNGSPYNCVNYAMQMLISILDVDDELYLVDGNTINSKSSAQYLNLKNKENLVKKVQRFTMGGVGDYRLIEPAINALRNSSSNKKWLVIIADGEWGTYNSYFKKGNYFDSFLQESGTNIIFLNINNPNSTNSLKQLLSKEYNIESEILVSGEKNVSKLIEQLENITTQINELSTKGIKSKSKSNNSVEITSKLPLRRIYAIEQSTNAQDVLNEIQLAEIDSTPMLLNISPRLSNEMVQNHKSASFVQGRVSIIKANDDGKIIDIDQKITIHYKDPLKLNQIKFIPEVAASLQVWAEGKISRIEDNEYYYCDKEDTAIIKMMLIKDNGGTLPKSILNNVDANLRYGTEEVKMSLIHDSIFFARIPIIEEKVSISAGASYSGYFNFKTNIISIIKEPCAEVKTQDAQIYYKIKVTEWNKHKEYPITPKVTSNGNEITDQVFDQLYLREIQSGKFNLEYTKKDGQFYVKLKKKGLFCPTCFRSVGRDSVIYELRQKGEKLEETGKLTVIVDVENVHWWIKCRKLILSIIGLIILIIYVIGLIKKPRFKKTARIIKTREKFGKPTKREDSKPLKTNKVNRYLIPFIPEKKMVHSFLFIATSNKGIILISRKKLGRKEYKIAGTPIDKEGKRDLRLRNYDYIEETSRSGVTTKYTYYRDLKKEF